jgi:transcriptional regulator with XRE-family HTH domain
MDAPDLTPAELGKRIRAAIHATGLTQHAVAAHAGLDPTAMSKALAGQRNFSTLEFARICETLGMSPLTLLSDGQPARDDITRTAVQRLRHVLELDQLLSELGLPARTDRWPFTLLDRAIEAYIRGGISIRPIAGLLGVDSDDLLDDLKPPVPWNTPNPT